MSGAGWTIAVVLLAVASGLQAAGATTTTAAAGLTAAVAAFGVWLLVEFRRQAADVVPLLRLAVGVALAALLGADLAGPASSLGSGFFVIAQVAWLLALRVPAPEVVLRDAAPFPGSIKIMMAIPFLLWPVLAVFLLAPEMPQGQGAVAVGGASLALIGATAVSRIGRVGPRSFGLVLGGVVLLGVGWTVEAADTPLFAFAGGPAVSLAAALAGRLLLTAGLLAPDAPRITEAALALAAELAPEPASDAGPPHTAG